MSLIDFGKKHLVPGLIGQILITFTAGVASVVHNLVVSLTFQVARFPPPVKYGPPVRPSDIPVPKYGVPTSPLQFPGHIDTGMLFTTDHILPWLAMAASLALYAWVIAGWAFWGSIWYFKNKDKKE